MTEEKHLPQAGHAFIVANPNSGSYDEKALGRALQEVLEAANWTHELYQITGDEGEDVPGLVRAACDRGADVAVAYGGDGTVSAVVNGLVGTSVPLGIIPGGTGNALAQQLGIPLPPAEALGLLVGPDHRLQVADALRVFGRHYVLNVSAGLSSTVMRDTPRASKKMLGRLAYLLEGAKQLAGWQPHRFWLEVDGRHVQGRASELLISNASLIGGTPLRWELDVQIGDGEFLLCIIHARTVGHLLNILWSMIAPGARTRLVRYMRLRERIRVEAEETLVVEGDGEVIGETPFEGQVVPGALRIVAPAEEDQE